MSKNRDRAFRRDMREKIGQSERHDRASAHSASMTSYRRRAIAQMRLIDTEMESVLARRLIEREGL